MAEWFADELGHKLAKGSLCLVALDGNRVAGFNVISFGSIYIPLLNMTRSFREGEAWSEHIGVHKDYRKMGLASQLRYRILAELKLRGIKRLYGGALRSNIASLKLARRIGFKEFADVYYRRICGVESRVYRRVRV